MKPSERIEELYVGEPIENKKLGSSWGPTWTGFDNKMDYGTAKAVQCILKYLDEQYEKEGK